MCNFFFLLPGKIFLETLVDEIQGEGKRGSIFVSAHATAIPTSEFTNLTSKELRECLHTVYIQKYIISKNSYQLFSLKIYNKDLLFLQVSQNLTINYLFVFCTSYECEMAEQSQVHNLYRTCKSTYNRQSNFGFVKKWICVVFFNFFEFKMEI